jgi:cytoskeletal protein RodZ
MLQADVLTQKGVSVMKVVGGAICLTVALTLIVAAGAFAQMTPQAEDNTDSQVTNTKITNTNANDKTSTNPTTSSTQDSTTPTTTSTPATETAPATDCPSEIAGMNTVLKVISADERAALGDAGKLPNIPCEGYSYAADFTIVPDTTPATAASPEPQR